MTTRIFTIVFLFLAIGSKAQKSMHAYDLDKKSLQKFNEIVKKGREGKTNEAIKEFEKLYKKFPTLYEIPLRIATIYYEKKDYVNAKKYVNEVLSKDKEYDAEVYYTAGMIAYDAKNYEEAEKHFSDFIWRNDDTHRTPKAIKLKDESSFRYKALKNPKPYQPKPLSNFINTSDSEFLPTLSLDGNTIYFTRRIDLNEEIFKSHKNESGEWSVATPIEDINTKYNEASASVSDDGSMLIFTKCEDKVTGYGSCDLYYSKYNEDKWGIPQNLGDKINTPGWESQPCVIDNGKSIIFSSDRKGGQGGRDLWIVSRMNNGKWGIAKNLGENINTTGHEESPFLHPDGNTLYFRSNGLPGMGDFDIYMSRWNEEKNTWGKAVNLGYPINTEKSEGALYVSSDGKTAYYAGDAIGVNDKNKNLDLYQFELPFENRANPISYVKLRVRDKETKQAVRAKFYLINLRSKDTIIVGDIIHESTLFSLKTNHSYAFYIEKEGYIFHSENFNTTATNNLSNKFEINIELQKIKSNIPNQPIVLNNLFFETGSYTLKSESDIEIQKLLTLLENNPSLKIKIIGHTDNVGSDMDNQLLSENRAKAIVSVLMSKGIDRSRLSYEGKGESMPIADNNTESGRSKNRRTEFLIIE